MERTTTRDGRFYPRRDLFIPTTTGIKKISRLSQNFNPTITAPGSRFAASIIFVLNSVFSELPLVYTATKKLWEMKLFREMKTNDKTKDRPFVKQRMNMGHC